MPGMGRALNQTLLRMIGTGGSGSAWPRSIRIGPSWVDGEVVGARE